LRGIIRETTKKAKDILKKHPKSKIKVDKAFVLA